MSRELQFTIVSAKSKIANAAEMWKRQYFNERSGQWSRRSHDIYKQIVFANGDPAKIEAAIGNKSWTKIFCSGCHEYAAIAAEFGNDEPCSVCIQCLKDAAQQAETFLETGKQ